MKHTRAVLVGLALLVSACADSFEAKLEEARVLLDDAQYDAAVQKAQEAVDQRPDSQEAKIVLASALFGSAAFEPSPGCPEEDTGILGKLACVLDERRPDETDLETFARIAPSEGNIETLERATDALAQLALEIEDPGLKKTVSLKLFLARLFELGIVQLRVAPTPGDPCQTLSSADDERFNENLNQVTQNGQDAGLPSDFSLFERVQSIRDAIQAAGDLVAYFPQAFDCN